MPSRRLLAALLVLLPVTACSPAPAPGPAAVADSERDQAEIQKTLDAWYTAMQAADSAGTVRPLTAEFYLLEDTLPLNRAQLVAGIIQDKSGRSWTSSRSDYHTRLHGDVAWTTLRNHETSHSAAGKACEADFLETVVFVREDHRWLIDRYHAAAVKPWTC